MQPFLLFGHHRRSRKNRSGSVQVPLLFTKTISVRSLEIHFGSFDGQWWSSRPFVCTNCVCGLHVRTACVSWTYELYCELYCSVVTQTNCNHLVRGESLPRMHRKGCVRNTTHSRCFKFKPFEPFEPFEMNYLEWFENDVNGDLAEISGERCFANDNRNDPGAWLILCEVRKLSTS